MRIAITVCAIIFAVALQVSAASDDSPALFKMLNNKAVTRKQEIDKTIDDLIAWINDKVQTAKAGAEAFLNVIIEKVAKEQHALRVKVDTVLINIDKFVDDITGRTPGVNVTECTKMAEEFRVVTLDLVVGSQSCVGQQISQGSKHLSSISKTIEFVIAELKKIKSDADKCLEHVNNVTSAVRAIACVNKAGIRAAWAATKKVPSLTIDSTKLGTQLATIPINLTTCAASNSFNIITDKYNDVTGQIMDCVHSKITGGVVEYEESTRID